MVNPTSATSLNYLNNLTDTLDDIDYPTELLIPPISVNQTLSQTTSEHIHPLRQQWEIHFHREQLTFDHQQCEATYHWVAHLFTVHPIRIYHPTFGLLHLQRHHKYPLIYPYQRQARRKLSLYPQHLSVLSVNLLVTEFSKSIVNNCKAKHWN